jgi:hypothetical protein
MRRVTADAAKANRLASFITADRDLSDSSDVFIDSPSELFDSLAAGIDASDDAAVLAILCSLTAVAEHPDLADLSHAPLLLISTLTHPHPAVRSQSAALISAILSSHPPPRPFLTAGVLRAVFLSLKTFADSRDLPSLDASVHSLCCLASAPGPPPRALLRSGFFDFWLAFLRADFIGPTRAAMAGLIAAVARRGHPRRAVPPLASAARAALQDGRLRFAWADSLAALAALGDPRRVVGELELRVVLDELLLDADPEVARGALLLLLAHVKVDSSAVSLDMPLVIGFCASGHERLAVAALLALQHGLASGRFRAVEEFGVCELLKDLLAEAPFCVKIEALRTAIVVLRLGWMEKCVELNFMEDFLRMIEMEDEEVFQLVIGAIVRVLSRARVGAAGERCWEQFCDDGGVEVFEQLCDSTIDIVACGAVRFVNQFKLRPESACLT